MQVIHYLGALLCTGSLMAYSTLPPEQPAEGLYVALSVECPSNMEGDRQIYGISYLNDGRIFLNDAELSQSALLQNTADAMRYRNDRVIWLRAEPEVSYGSVMVLLTGLAKSAPNLHVALITDRQGAGPVDPGQWAAAWKSGQRFANPVCFPPVAQCRDMALRGVY